MGSSPPPMLEKFKESYEMFKLKLPNFNRYFRIVKKIFAHISSKLKEQLKFLWK